MARTRTRTTKRRARSATKRAPAGKAKAKAPAARRPKPPKPFKKKPAAKPVRKRGTRTQTRRAKPAPVKRVGQRRRPAPPAAPPVAIPELVRPEGSGRFGSGAVVRLVESEAPIAALRELLDGIEGDLSIQQGQVVLGAAQLMLLPIAHEHRGGPEVKQLLDLVVSRWGAFPDRTGFHAQEFLRNALAAVGDDRDRVIQLAMLVPADASSELRFNLACAYAVAGERTAMLRAVRTALMSGASAAAVARDPDFETYRDDPELVALLERATPPEIAVDIRPHVVIVRAAIDAVRDTLRDYGEIVKLEEPATLDTILAAERAGKIQLPNDYRALLTISDGLTLWDHQFLGTADYRTDTLLAKRARDFIEMSARFGAHGIEDCVPLASWGSPNNWLLYDPFGRYRGGEPGIVLMLNADEGEREVPLDGVAAALEHFEEVARDVLATN